MRLILHIDQTVGQFLVGPRGTKFQTPAMQLSVAMPQKDKKNKNLCTTTPEFSGGTLKSCPLNQLSLSIIND